MCHAHLGEQEVTRDPEQDRNAAKEQADLGAPSEVLRGEHQGDCIVLPVSVDRSMLYQAGRDETYKDDA